MPRVFCLLALLLVVAACDQQTSEEPGVAAEPAPAPAAPPAAPPVVPEPAPAAEPVAPAAEPEAPAAKPVETSSTKTAEPVAKKPEATKPVEPPATKPAEPAAAPAHPASAATPCGEEGQPMCPLQAFMERNVQTPMEAGDLTAVGKGLARAAKLVPDASWNAGPSGWATIAQAGADAAAAGDAVAAKQSCKTCHKAFRNKYKAEFRTKPL